MRKIRNLVIGGIESKVFNLVLITVLMVVAAFMAVIWYQTEELTELTEDANRRQQENMAQISDATMQAVLDATMDRSTQMQAELSDTMFKEIKNDVRMMADYADKLFKDSEQYPAVPFRQPERFDGSSPMITWLHAPGVDPESEEFLFEAGLLGNMGDMMLSMLDNSDYLGACYIATPGGLTLMCDDPASSRESEAAGYVFDSRQRPWYIGAERTGSRYFTGLERDYYTDRIGITCAVPVYRNGKLVAVCGGDVYLDELAKTVAGSETESGFMFLLDGDGHVIFSPRTEGIFQVLPADVAADLRDPGYGALSELAAASLAGNCRVMEVDTGEGVYYMSGARIPTVGWAVIEAVEKEATKQPAQTMSLQHQQILAEATQSYHHGVDNSRKVILLLLGVITILAVISGLILAKRIVRPLNRMTGRIASLTGEDPAFEMGEEYRTGDEIEVLARSFAELSRRTREFMAENLRITAEKERIGAELNVATKIQADMLPRIFPPFPERREFDMYASMQPAKEVGGDFYDFFLVDNDHLAMVMADVSGKGVPAALFMVIAKTLIKNRAQMGGSPGEVLGDVNRQLCEANTSGLFVTVWLAILEISTGKGIACNAGHEHPALCHAGGEFAMVEYKHSPPLGLIEEIPCREHAFTLLPGDVVFVYTDGVTEASATRQNLFGEQRLLQALNSRPDVHPKEILKNVSAQIREFVGEADQFDDITMLCMKYYGPGEQS